jgi:hypothetical protein
MIRDEIKELKTGPVELRKFGLLVGGVFTVLGIVFWLRHKPSFPWFLGPGIVLILLGLVIPMGLKQVYIGWMTLAIVLGLIMSTVLLTLFFYLVMTPIGLVARVCGKDFLRLKMTPQAGTYWIPRAKGGAKQDYEQQF